MGASEQEEEILSEYDRLTARAEAAEKMNRAYDDDQQMLFNKITVLKMQKAQLVAVMKHDVIQLAILAAAVDEKQTNEYMESVYAAIRAAEEAK